MNTLATRFHPSPLLRSILLCVSGAIVLTISAKISIPFYPVPMTMQTLVVLLWGMLFGARTSASTVALYLVSGMMGFAVFSGTPEKGIGIAYMMGPTGGYLLGFLAAAAFCGYARAHGWCRSLLTTAFTMTLGTAIIYSFGLLWLGTLLGWDKPILAWGLMPFLAADATKIALGTLFLHVTRKNKA
ncbi:MAG: biotin transporter BioY [Pseudomonadota bacterium]